MSDDLKAWYQSRTVWGALIAISASLASAAGIEVTAGDEAPVVTTAPSMSAKTMPPLPVPPVEPT